MTTRLECDLLVLGAGMAGLSAGAYAAERGARVIVLEKSAEIGGSAILSGGVLWTAASRELMQIHGRGDPELSATILKNYPAAIQWIRGRETQISSVMPVLHGFGYEIDIIGHLRGCARTVQQFGGQIALETETASLMTDASAAVTGAKTRHRDGNIDILAKWTLLATGGFQNSAELRSKIIHPNARFMRVRSNLVSAGDAIRLGLEVGAELKTDNPGLYGHLVSESPDWGDPRLFLTLAQFHSPHSLLLNESGNRFCDETLGDHENNYQVLTQSGARALQFWDGRVQREIAMQQFVATVPALNKMEFALKRGGKGVISQTLDEVSTFADAHGFNGTQLRQSIDEFNANTAEGWELLSPAHTGHLRSLTEPPYYALIVHPAITFTQGGLSVGPDAQVRRAGGTVVGGLLAAGADVGNAYRIGYAGGLALAVTYGLEAARSAGYA